MKNECHNVFFHCVNSTQPHRQKSPTLGMSHHAFYSFAMAAHIVRASVLRGPIMLEVRNQKSIYLFRRLVWAAVKSWPPRSWIEYAYPDLRRLTVMPKGGHFAAWEQPNLLPAHTNPPQEPRAPLRLPQNISAFTCPLLLIAAVLQQIR